MRPDRPPVLALVQLCAAIDKDQRTREDIAKAAGVDRNTIRFWMDGTTTNPNIGQVDKVARALGYRLELRR